MCGVVGLKPTYGRVSLRGIYPNARSIDHAGLMARTTRDCGLFLQEMAGYDLEDPASVDVPVPDFCAEIESGVDGLRMGLCEDLTFVEIDSAVREAFNEAVDVLRHLGAEVRSVEFPLAERLNEAREALREALSEAIVVVLGHQDVLFGPVPAPRPGFVGPTQTEREIRTS